MAAQPNMNAHSSSSSQRPSVLCRTLTFAFGDTDTHTSGALRQVVDNAKQPLADSKGRNMGTITILSMRCATSAHVGSMVDDRMTGYRGRAHKNQRHENEPPPCVGKYPIGWVRVPLLLHLWLAVGLASSFRVVTLQWNAIATSHVVVSSFVSTM